MNISLDIFNQNKISYDWKTLYVGLKLNLIKPSDITNYAVQILSNYPETDNPNIIQLAWGDDNLDFESFLVNILEELHINDLDLDADMWELEKRKWRFGVLAYLEMMHQDDLEELLNLVAEVYADFNYPKDMDSFINYLPPQDGFDPSKYSKEENIVRLYDLFNAFLTKERRYLQNDMTF